jgi:hypothetical protein
MKKSLLAGVAVLGLSLFAGYSYAADAEKITGVLIDQKCGAKFVGKDDGEAGAAKHPASCAAKEACAKSGYFLISGKQGLKLDEAGVTKAKEYLAKDGASTKVTIEGTKDGDMLKVSSIEAAK